MKQVLFTLTLALLCNLITGQVYVKQDATGTNDGTSWTNAYTDLQDALDNATPHSEIWVAEATYRPGPVGSPADSIWFSVTKSLKIYGGFNGSETTLSQRNWVDNPTILSGDINGDDVDDDFIQFRDDNAIHVIQAINPPTVELLFDGLVIRGGDAKTGSPPMGSNFFEYTGGAITGNGNIEIRNCVFEQNQGSFGSTFYLFNGDFIVENNTIQNNNSFFSNGYIQSTNFSEVRDCYFSNGYSETFGGGMTIVNGNAVIDNCTFTDNTAREPGGALFFIQNPWNTISSPTVEVNNCTFTNNSAQLAQGGAIGFNNFFYDSHFIVDSCYFKGNTATWGGSIAPSNIADFYFGNPASLFVTLSNCEFESDSAISEGGSITSYCDADTMYTHISNCIFTSCHTFAWGGAVLIERNPNNSGYASATINDCDFVDNSATQHSGAVSGYYADSLYIHSCHFENSATDGNSPILSGGGAIGLNSSNATIINTQIAESHSATDGDALFLINILGDTTTCYLENVLINSGSGNNAIFAATPLTLVNATIADNNIGIKADSTAALSFQNTILNNTTNFSQSGNPSIVSLGGNISSDATLSGVFIGAGGFNDFNTTDPQLDAGYVPLNTSPALDVGNPDNIMTTVDLAGNTRIQGSGIDIGAFETPFNVSTKEVIYDAATIELAPNPTTVALTVMFKKHIFAEKDVYIVNTIGQRMMPTQQISAHAASHTMRVDMLPAGQYYLVVETEEEVFVEGFVRR